ncbi:hypothetical protein ACU4GR_04700 [Methylobacterium oryzae CBMB20]
MPARLEAEESGIAEPWKAFATGLFPKQYTKKKKKKKKKKKVVHGARLTRTFDRRRSGIGRRGRPVSRTGHITERPGREANAKGALRWAPFLGARPYLVWTL